MDEVQSIPVSPGVVVPEEPEKPQLELQVSPDKMDVYLRVKPSKNGSRQVTYDEVLEFLKQYDIVYGIKEDAIRTWVDERKFFLELHCAQGLEPVDEGDMEVEFFVRPDSDIVPKENEDGIVDFRDLGLVQSVSKGETLCRLLPPSPGQDGEDIFGHPVEYRKGRQHKFPTGKNIEVSADGLSLLATMDGCVEFKGETLNINDVFVMKGNVSASTGNIDFTGSVQVQGDVLEGFSVKAGGNITVRGMVEGAQLEAGGNISLSNGMNGMGKGVIRAGGSVTGKFFENVKLIACGGNVYADVIMNTQVEAEGSIVLKGRNGLLVGGKCKAGKRIYANMIGSSSGTKTEVAVESPELTRLLVEGASSAMESMKALQAMQKSSLESVKAQIENIKQAITSNPSSAPEKVMLRDAIIKKSRIEGELRDLEGRIGKFEQESTSFVDYCVIGLRMIYAGTRLKVGDFTQTVSKDTGQMKFWSDREHLASGPVLPSDRPD